MTQRLIILLAILFVLIGAIAYTSRDKLSQLWSGSPPPSFNPLPSPLRVSLDQPAGILSIAGLLSATNQHRIRNNLPTLSLNPALTQAANYKLDDMLELQYFNHVSPSGQDLAAIVDSFHYEYLAIGANLALGNFTDNVGLIQAWMDSPGHRANILNPAYTNIGLAVKPGMFEGKPAWLAVQIFAPPPMPTER